jgi:hypothetical protein
MNSNDGDACFVTIENVQNKTISSLKDNMIQT